MDWDKAVKGRILMEVIVRGKNFEVTDALKEHVTKKLGKMAKLFDPHPVTAHAVLSIEKERQIVEVTVPIDGLLLRGEEATPDMYASVDLVVEKLEKQYAKFKTRVRRRHSQTEYREPPPMDVSNVVRRKSFPAKPMLLDEALLQMDLLGHDFFVFTNGETDTINVLYRRRDGEYGLLEPR